MRVQLDGHPPGLCRCPKQPTADVIACLLLAYTIDKQTEGDLRMTLHLAP